MRVYASLHRRFLQMEVLGTFRERTYAKAGDMRRREEEGDGGMIVDARILTLFHDAHVSGP